MQNSAAWPAATPSQHPSPQHTTHSPLSATFTPLSLCFLTGGWSPDVHRHERADVVCCRARAPVMLYKLASLGLIGLLAAPVVASDPHQRVARVAAAADADKSLDKPPPSPPAAPPPFSPPPFPPPLPAAYFAVLDWETNNGVCQLSENRRCVVNKKYGNAETCVIKVLYSMDLTAPTFEVGPDDYLMIDGVKYNKANPLKDLAVTEGTTVLWKSDGTQTEGDWKVCGKHRHPEPLSPPPPPPPSIPPPSPPFSPPPPFPPPSPTKLPPPSPHHPEPYVNMIPMPGLPPAFVSPPSAPGNKAQHHDAKAAQHHDAKAAQHRLVGKARRNEHKRTTLAQGGAELQPH